MTAFHVSVTIPAPARTTEVIDAACEGLDPLQHSRRRPDWRAPLSLSQPTAALPHPTLTRETHQVQGIHAASTKQHATFDLSNLAYGKWLRTSSQLEMECGVQTLCKRCAAAMKAC